MAPTPTASLLTIPCELRNAIYLYLFHPDFTTEVSPTSSNGGATDALAAALNLPSQFQYRSKNSASGRPWHRFSILQTCKQIHSEAHLLAFHLSRFDVTGLNAYPDCFATLTSPMPVSKVNAIRQVTLTARVSHLRALNEAWHGLPFGNPDLFLDVLMIVPTRPDLHHQAFAEIADSSQAHTLAYVFAETFKRLKNVRVVEVRNRGYFNEAAWLLVYRTLVYRMWRWGGERCGVKFLSCGDEVVGEQWFRIWPGDEDGDEACGLDVGEEIRRLVGASGQMPHPNFFMF